MLQERADLCHRLCQEHGFLWWQAYSEVFLGWLAVGRGEEAGIERMQGAIAAWQAKGMLIGTDNLSLVLADGCLAAAGRRPYVSLRVRPRRTVGSGGRRPGTPPRRDG